MDVSAEMIRLFLALWLLGMQPRVKVFEASAYTRMCEARSSPWFGLTASGETARLGMCALPAEAPFGSVVWLDGGDDGGSGLGTGVARMVCTDRGGAIVRLANGVLRLDRCLTGLTGSDADDERAARAWGRRVRVGILIKPGAGPVRSVPDAVFAKALRELVARWGLEE